MLEAVCFQILTAWILATAVYQIGSRIENNTLNLADLLVIGAILLAIIGVLTNPNKNTECKMCPYTAECKK